MKLPVSNLPVLAAMLLAAMLLASPASAEATLLSGAEMRKQIVGNTMVGKYDDGSPWKEYYLPTGEIRGTDKDHAAYTAQYEIREDLICFDYSWDNADWCGVIGIDGDNLTFYQDGKLIEAIQNTKLVPGNPFNF
jgi:hypothetical protein